ncbi:MAG: hypothetical protein NTZ35_08095 [Ignavibacteriales bacterium]|nr:hypothetical protein [Ignavibacteriales bacterium]
MVSAFIFGLHACAAIYAFITRKRAGGVSEGLLAVAFLGIIFAVGWTISTVCTNLLFTPEFFIKWYYRQTDSLFLRTLRKELNRDTISLLLLTFGELGFYYFFLSGKEQELQELPTEEKKS